MKKLFYGILLCLLAAALALGVTAAVQYARADALSFAVPRVTLDGQEAACVEAEWFTPLLGGVMHKRGVKTADALPPRVITQRSPAQSAEEGCDALLTVTCTDSGEVLYSGSSLACPADLYTHNGNYEAEWRITVPQTEKGGYGSFTYRQAYTLAVQPQITVSHTEAQQGDIICVRTDGGFYTDAPVLETELTDIRSFMPQAAAQYAAYVPVNYNCPPGEYDITVTLGQTQRRFTVQVTPREYETQHMVISQQTADETMNNPLGPANWRERIWPLWETADDTQYWDGVFIMPCQAEISTQFGLYRYTNSDPVPERHTGIDIAADQGTPVLASGAGRVVLAEEIIYTGNTVVIEHGGGLKTYYFHMDNINVCENDQVQQGQIIGHVGSTGYSTGAHLHFEVKIGRASVNPWSLFDGTNGIYYTGG